eukprot:PhM_4_TR7928/c0_g1_i1/m.102951
MLLTITGDDDVIRGRSKSELLWSVDDARPLALSLPALHRILLKSNCCTKASGRGQPSLHDASNPFDIFTVIGGAMLYVDVMAASPAALGLNSGDVIYVAKRVPVRAVFAPPPPSVLAEGTRLDLNVALLDVRDRRMPIPAGTHITVAVGEGADGQRHTDSRSVPHGTVDLPSEVTFSTPCITRPLSQSRVARQPSDCGSTVQLIQQLVQFRATVCTSAGDPMSPATASCLVQSTAPNDDTSLPAPSPSCDIAAPSIYPPSGTYPNGLCVVIGNDESSDAPVPGIIVFTTDGTDPATGGVKYVGPFHLNMCGTVVVRAIRVSPGHDVCSAVSRVDLHLTPARPEIEVTPEGGDGPREATMRYRGTVPKEGTVEVRYTVDGTAPTKHSALYSSPICVREVAAGVLRACAVWVPSVAQCASGVPHVVGQEAVLQLAGVAAEREGEVKAAGGTPVECRQPPATAAPRQGPVANVRLLPGACRRDALDRLGMVVRIICESSSTTMWTSPAVSPPVPCGTNDANPSGIPGVVGSGGRGGGGRSSAPTVRPPSGFQSFVNAQYPHLTFSE